MKTYEVLANAAAHIASRRQAASSNGKEEEEKLWRYVRALSDFVHVTGQIYRFEAFLNGEVAAERLQPHASARLSSQKNGFAHLAADLLLRAHSEVREPEQRHCLFVLIALLNFIADTGQLGDAEDFFVNQLEYAPVAIAHFTSHEEAEAWLKGVAEPPSPARILIGDEYHQFWFVPGENARGMCRDYAIEPAMEALAARGIQPETPSFASRTEAEEWFKHHPANPYAFVAIGGEHYFAVHHRRLKRHSFHHVASTLTAWGDRKREVEREAAQEEASQSGDVNE